MRTVLTMLALSALPTFALADNAPMPSYQVESPQPALMLAQAESMPMEPTSLDVQVITSTRRSFAQEAIHWKQMDIFAESWASPTHLMSSQD